MCIRDSLDAEVFFNLQNKLGLYSSMWAGQIDYYSNTDIVSNVSFGLNRAISKTISYDLGLGSNITFSNEVQTTPEYFTGIDINGFSFYAYFQENDIAYESWFKPGIEMLSSPNLDMLFYIYVENDGYEINCNVSKQLNQGIIGGVILGYENYSDELNYQQQDGSKSFKISNTGGVIGSEVPQVYIERNNVIRLKAFKRVFLDDQETKKVKLKISVEDLELWG